MKLPLAWLFDYLPEDARGAHFADLLAAACRRWELEPAAEPAHTLGRLLTFAGFACEGVDGKGADAILDLDVLSNRPDGQCILGLAREVAAILHVPLRPPPCDLRGLEKGEPASALAKVRIDDAEMCPRYTARVIRGVKVGPSPQWLRERLEWLGLQPINNIVDITNFVMFELNQPLHAFDLMGLSGREIIVRRARKGEPFEPLYGKVPPLTPETLVIADAERARAIAGVIGGKGSEIASQTTVILLEAAYFNAANTRRTVRRLKVMDGHGTESSFRFERGIDLDGVAEASARAVRLMVELAGGAVAPGVIDVWPHPRPPKTVELRLHEVDRVFGAPVPVETTRGILTALGCEIAAERASGLAIKIPSWRRGDLEREIDLIEEVARLYGYNHVPDTTALRALVPARSAVEITSNRLRTLFTALGYYEAITDSLLDPKWAAPAVWTSDKPLSLDKSSVLREDHAALRNSLLASLLAVRRYNQDQRTGETRLFEIGKVFMAKGGPLPAELAVLGIIDDRGFQYLADALARMGEALELSGAHLKFVPPQNAPEFLLPGQACRVLRVREMPGNERAEDAIGWLGTISPALQAAFDLRKPVAMCELDLAALAALPSAPRRYAALPAFPEVVRDVALVVDEQVSWGAVDSFARAWLKQDQLRDASEPPRFLSAYRGKQAGAGKKSLAFSLVYRAADRTLTDEEVNAAHEKFQQALLKEFKATLRA